MTPTLFATLAYGLALTRVFVWRVPRLRAVKMAVLLVAMCALLHLPVAGVSLLMLLRGTLGDLSFASLAFLLSSFLEPRPENPRHRVLSLILALAGLVFLLLASGLFPIDPYAMGYAPTVLPCFVGGVALVFWYCGKQTLSFVCLAALIGWRLQWLDSTNLWDYLLDTPFIMILCVMSCLRQMRISSQRTSGDPPSRAPN